MSAYLRAVVRDRPNTRARSSGSARAVSASCSTRPQRMRSMPTRVAPGAGATPATPWLHPRRQVISLDTINSRRLKEDQGDPPATG